MGIRYFVRTTFDEKPLALYRLNVDDEAEEVFEDVWRNDAWKPTDRLIKFLIDLDTNLNEVDEQGARAFAPSAFADDAARSVGGFEVSKAVSEEMFTLGPMYIPDRLDAHSEWTDADELQKAVWEYVKGGDRRIRLQHDRDEVAGEWVEVMTWPYEVNVPMMQKNAEPQMTTFPPNTVFLGVKWRPWAWELIKAGKIRGYSIGGKAERLFVDLEDTE
jgi:hypothetical protein